MCLLTYTCVYVCVYVCIFMYIICCIVCYILICPLVICISALFPLLDYKLLENRNYYILFSVSPSSLKSQWLN